MTKTPPLRELLDRHGLHLRRDLGQNFLVEEAMAERLVETAGVAPGDCVIEVGTGLGMLTRALAGRAEFVLSFEIDSGLVRATREEGLVPDNVELVHADALKEDLATHVTTLRREHSGPVRFVANLPYASATPVLRRLLDLRHELAGWAVMLQLEVAERVFAPVGTKDYGSLAVLHHLCAELEGRMKLGARCFFPVPKVDSTFVCLRANDSHNLGHGELRRVERVVRAAFGKRRKTLLNALRGGGFDLDAGVLAAVLESVGIDAKARAETVDPAGLLALARALFSEIDGGRS